MTTEAWWRRWWTRLAPPVDPPSQVPAWTPERPSLTSPDGFMRQAAVEACERSGDVSVLPMLLLRANDWVPQVRLAAQRAVRALLHDEALPTWLQSLAALQVLARARRADHADLLDAAARFLAQPAHRTAVLAAMNAAEPAVRRHVLAMLLAVDETADALLSEVLLGGDATLSRIGLAAVERRPLGQRRTWLALACGSPVSSTRAQALRSVLSQAPGDALIDAMVFDRSVAVRGVALHALRGSSRAPATLARALAMAEGPLRPEQCVAVLHVVATLDAAQGRRLGAAMLKHPSPRVRQAAFTLAVEGADATPPPAWWVAALGDASPRVQRLVAERVRRGAVPPDEELICQVLRDHPAAGTWRHGMALLASGHPWRYPVHVLGLLRDTQDPVLVDVCHEALAPWSPQFVQPSAAQRDALAAAWRACARRVEEPLKSRLAALVAGR